MADEPADGVGSVQELLATVLHEVRTPLACLTTTMDVLVGSFVELPPDEALDLLRRMQRSTSWLQNLVDNLTVAAQVESRQLHLRIESVRVRECLDNCLILVSPLLQRAGQEIVVRGDLDAQIIGDSRRIEQVLVNLVMNASKYGGNEHPIEIRARQDPNFVRIAVVDRGPGIALAEQQNIFQRYVRGEAAAESGATGLGLGLHIVKTLVERQGGAVGVESTLGVGSNFWFDVPSALSTRGAGHSYRRVSRAATSRGRVRPPASVPLSRMIGA